MAKKNAGDWTKRTVKIDGFKYATRSDGVVVGQVVLGSDVMDVVIDEAVARQVRDHFGVSRKSYNGPAGEQVPGTNYSVDELGFLGIADTHILAAVARGELDLNALAKRELAGRGVDYNGQWVGFERAKYLMSLSRVALGNGKTTLVSVPESV